LKRYTKEKCKNKKIILLVPENPEENIQEYCSNNNIRIVLWDEILEIIKQILNGSITLGELEKNIMQQYCDYLTDLIKQEGGGFEMNYEKDTKEKISNNIVARLCKYLFKASKMYNDIGGVFKKIQRKVKNIKLKKYKSKTTKNIEYEGIWGDKKVETVSFSFVGFHRKVEGYYICFGIDKLKNYKLYLYFQKYIKGKIDISESKKNKLKKLFKFKIYGCRHPKKIDEWDNFFYYREVKGEELNKPDKLVEEIKRCLKGMHKILK
jgi:hypothetical protein